MLRTFLLVTVLFTVGVAAAQDIPYFVTYSHHLEEPGNLEMEANSTVGIPRKGQPGFIAPYMELEYGVAARWTTELYLEGLSTKNDSTILTGWRLENRVRPLRREHWINPVLYFEFENINEASRIQKEVVGHAAAFDEPNAELRRSKAREVETKLILSSTVHDWNISENFIAEKNLSADEGFEFGYAVGVSRPLASSAGAKACRFCRENMTGGIELYGGLGSTEAFGFGDTAHYLAPTWRWQATDRVSVGVSPGIGLTHASEPVLVRFGISYEFKGAGQAIARAFRGKR